MKSRKLLFLIACIGFVFSSVSPVHSSAGGSPFEADRWTTPKNALDIRVETVLSKHGAQFRNPCSDEVFIRRVFVDLLGTLPTSDEVDTFLKDPRPDKRSVLIDFLFSREEFADYQSLKWCDLLRVKSEYPINLWPNAVQAYHHWIRTSIKDNLPYDRFATALLTANGSNFFDPPSNFYRGIQGRDSLSIAKAVALTFMGTRIEKWPKVRQSNMAQFFSRVSYKKTDEWKEEIVYSNPLGNTRAKLIFPDGQSVNVAADADPRCSFAGWLVSPKNQWFARNIVNRMWFWTMGHGLINEPDDIRPGNPPASPEVLAYMEKELIDSHYDLRQVYRLILNSRTYQQSSVPHGKVEIPALDFAHYTVRRLDAEVLIDALCSINGKGEGYSSATPEPYTFIPKENRTIALADGSITSSFLASFGRPSRDSGLESERNNSPSDAQCLYLLNSTDVQKRIDSSPRLAEITNADRKNVTKMVRDVYLFILSRRPTPEETKVVEQYIKDKGYGRRPTSDLAWALINSKEFLYRH